MHQMSSFNIAFAKLLHPILSFGMSYLGTLGPYTKTVILSYLSAANTNPHHFTRSASTGEQVSPCLPPSLVLITFSPLLTALHSIQPCPTAPLLLSCRNSDRKFLFWPCIIVSHSSCSPFSHPQGAPSSLHQRPQYVRVQAW